MRMAPNRIPKVALHWTTPGKRKRGRPRTTWRRIIKRQTKNNMEEDNNIRAAGGG